MKPFDSITGHLEAVVILCKSIERKSTKAVYLSSMLHKTASMARLAGSEVTASDRIDFYDRWKIDPSQRGDPDYVNHVRSQVVN